MKYFILKLVIKMFTDTHCHITKEDYESISDLNENAKKNGIIKMINNGTDTKTNKEVLEIHKKFLNIYPAIGIHPEFANTYTEDDLKYIEENIKEIVAIGEIGLDYHYDDVNKNRQISLFRTQLELAKKYNKPVIIHTRDALVDTINVLSEYSELRGVIHCFSGSYETANIFIKMGFLLGIGGVLTFKNSKLHEVIEKIDCKNIVLETDSPFLTPEPYRGKQNEPANVIFIAKKICDIKNISLEELSKITENNVRGLFDI